MSLDEQRITKTDSRNMQDITKRSNSHVIRIPESEEWGKYLKKYWPKISCICQKASSDSLKKLSSVHSLSRVWLFANPWTATHQASLSITNSQSLLKLMSIALVMPSNHLILCHPLLLLSSIFPSIKVFSNESVLHIRWLKYWSFSFSISPSNEVRTDFL